MLEDLEKVPLSGEDTKYESVAVDYETWRVLVRWSEEECRSPGGQIRWVVKKYGPELLADYFEIPELEPKPVLLMSKGSPDIPEVPAWEVKHFPYPVRVSPKKSRFRILKILGEVDEPCHNTAVYVYLMAEFPDLVTTAEQVGSHMSYLFARGLVQRRRNMDLALNELGVSERYQYILSRKGEQILRKYG
tara:strand:- start:1641 stop:2210 length:570 start_codon:yes stop_codon:yes gene_type:complete